MSKKSLLIACVLGVMPCVAHAYIGPGVGLSAIGSFFALLGAILLAIVGFVWFPLKRLFGRRKPARGAASDDGSAESTASMQTDAGGGEAGSGAPRD